MKLPDIDHWDRYRKNKLNEIDEYIIKHNLSSIFSIDIPSKGFNIILTAESHNARENKKIEKYLPDFISRFTKLPYLKPRITINRPIETSIDITKELKIFKKKDPIPISYIKTDPRAKSYKSQWKKVKNIYVDTETCLCLTNQQLEELNNLKQENREKFYKNVKGIPYIVTWCNEDDIAWIKANYQHRIKDLTDSEKKHLKELIRQKVKFSFKEDGIHEEFLKDIYDEPLKSRRNVELIIHNVAYDFPYILPLVQQCRDKECFSLNLLVRSSFTLEAFINAAIYKHSSKLRITCRDTFFYSRDRLTDDDYKHDITHGLANIKLTDINDLKALVFEKNEWHSFHLSNYRTYAIDDIVELVLKDWEIAKEKETIAELLGLTNIMPLSGNISRAGLALRACRYLCSLLPILDNKELLEKLRLNTDKEKKGLPIKKVIEKTGGQDIIQLFRYNISEYPEDMSKHFTNLHDLYQSSQDVVCGGFTFNNSNPKLANYETKGDKNIYAYDINNSYGFIMKNGLPAGKPIKVDKVEDESKYVYMYQLYNKHKWKTPEWSKQFNFISRPPLNEDQIIELDAGSFWCFKEYYDCLNKMVSWDIEIVAIYRFERSYIIRDYINILTKKREEVGKDSYEGQICKLLINSIYGKMCERSYEKSKAWLNGEEIEIDNEVENYRSPMCGVYICEMGQTALLKACYKITNKKLKVIGGDTDSIKVLCRETDLKKIEDCIDIGEQLGQWKLEGIYVRCCIRPGIRKKYYYEPAPGKLYSKALIKGFTLSGVDGHWKEALLELLKNGEGIWLVKELFNPDKNYCFKRGKLTRVLNYQGAPILLGTDVRIDKDKEPTNYLRLNRSNKILYVEDANHNLTHSLKW